MDLTTALEGLKAAIQIARTIKDAETRLEKAELTAKLAELMSNLADAQVAVTEHRLDRVELEAEIQRLKEALETKGNTERRRDALVTVDAEGKWTAGPFCISCWETGQALRSLTERSEGGLVCPSCGHGIRMHSSHWGDVQGA